MITIRDRVRFAETDLMGVVHHANYLRWLEMGRVAYMRDCGIALNDLMADGVIFPVTELSVRYKNSLAFDDEFAVETKMTAFNRAKMEFNYRVIRVSDGAVAVEAHTRNVFTDRSGRITRLKSPWYEQILEKFNEDKAVEE